MKMARWLSFAWLVSLGVGGAAHGAAMSAAKATVKALQVRRDGNYVRVNNQPTMLLWARGLSEPGELERYAAAGFNTVAIPITDLSEEALRKASALASAAEERGLLVVGVLDPAKLTDEQGQAVDLDPVLDSYPDAVRGFVEKAVDTLGAHPRLVGWIAEVRSDQVVWGSPGFRRYLAGLYPSISDLNDSWSSKYNNFSRVSTDGVRDLDGGRVGNVGRASVDYARYRQQTYADAVAAWTTALKQTDPKRLIFVSGLTDYRSAIGLERGMDGLVMETTPKVAETDYITGNVQAVDVARRGNRLIAVQTLDLAKATPTRLRDWLDLTLLHGASGVQLTDWAQVRDSEALLATVERAAETIQTSGQFPARPLARTGHRV